MTVFIVSVVMVLVISAACSLSEAAIYAVRLPYVRQLAESGSRAGGILETFKANMERPIAAILIINTAVDTAGAASGAGSERPPRPADPTPDTRREDAERPAEPVVAPVKHLPRPTRR